MAISLEWLGELCSDDPVHIGQPATRISVTAPTDALVSVMPDVAHVDAALAAGETSVDPGHQHPRDLVLEAPYSPVDVALSAGACRDICDRLVRLIETDPRHELRRHAAHH